MCWVQQGSLLVYENDLFEVPHLLTLIVFVENTNLFLAHRNVTELCFPVNCELDKISSWFIANDLSLNEE